MSDDADYWVNKVENQGMWSITLGSNDRVGGNADFGFQSVLNRTDMYKDNEWNVLIQEPLTYPSEVKVGREQHEAEKEEPGLFEVIKGDTTEIRERDVTEDVLVKPRSKDIFEDGNDYEHPVHVSIPYTVPEENFSDSNFGCTRGNTSTYERIDILMPEYLGENLGDYLEEELNSRNNLNQFVSQLTQNRGDRSEQLVNEVLDGNGEFGPRDINRFEEIDAHTKFKDHPRFSDYPVRGLRGDESYQNSDIEEPDVVSEVQRLNW